ncbi:hypothetical protein Droror1_Dr00027689 [Drosera rotundifolia]
MIEEGSKAKKKRKVNKETSGSKEASIPMAIICVAARQQVQQMTLNQIAAFHALDAMRRILTVPTDGSSSGDDYSVDEVDDSEASSSPDTLNVFSGYDSCEEL